MFFKDFIQRLASVLRGESNTAVFTRTIFEAIIQKTDTTLWMSIRIVHLRLTTTEMLASDESQEK